MPRSCGLEAWSKAQGRPGANLASLSLRASGICPELPGDAPLTSQPLQAPGHQAWSLGMRSQNLWRWSQTLGSGAGEQSDNRVEGGLGVPSAVHSPVQTARENAIDFFTSQCTDLSDKGIEMSASSTSAHSRTASSRSSTQVHTPRWPWRAKALLASHGHGCYPLHITGASRRPPGHGSGSGSWDAAVHTAAAAASRDHGGRKHPEVVQGKHLKPGQLQISRRTHCISPSSPHQPQWT